MSALLTQSPGDTVQTGTEKVDPAKFKCTTAARGILERHVGRGWVICRRWTSYALQSRETHGSWVRGLYVEMETVFGFALNGIHVAISLTHHL